MDLTLGILDKNEMHFDLKVKTIHLAEELSEDMFFTDALITPITPCAVSKGVLPLSYKNNPSTFLYLSLPFTKITYPPRHPHTHQEKRIFNINEIIAVQS